MSKRCDPRCHVGETHGVYTLVDVLEEKDKYGRCVYKGVCNECGYVKYSHYGDFHGAKSMTTVCNHVDATGRYVVQTQWSNRRIGNTFKSMKSRCYCKTDKDYRFYGARGITICEEWLNNPILFEKWAIENGYIDNLTIDRIDSNGNYSPKNCRWVTATDNSRYKSTTSYINVDGEVHTGKEWSRILNLGVNRINTYIRKYGIENTIEFIRRYKTHPSEQLRQNQNFYDLYMENNTSSI